MRAQKDVLFGIMQRIGHSAMRLIARPATGSGASFEPDAPGPPTRAVCGLWAALGLLAVVMPALWMWGFTVDDALIGIRYARNLALGLGWRFDAHGPSTDGVTPLPWPLVLLPMARAEPLVVLWRAKLLGIVAWSTTGAALGVAIGRVQGTPLWARAAAVATIALSVPIAAHAVTGMETAVATALATAATLAIRKPGWTASMAGLAASFRPEMVPWAFVLAIGATICVRASVGRIIVAGATAMAPFACCAILRAVVWGRPAPLAIMAKPSDIDHGLAYAGAVCVVTVVPLLALAPLALRRTPIAMAIVLAAVAHIVAIIVVGGDWMPYARLMVPVTPSLAYAAVMASEHAHPLATAIRSGAAIALGLMLIAHGGSKGRGVGAQREALIAEARPALAGSHCVAALDVGWVGAATNADLVDLAGVTDPEVAALPGGHTSKRVDAIFLLSRNVDALLLYASTLLEGELGSWDAALYPRAVEARLARDVVIKRHFVAVAWFPLGTDGGGYVLLRRRERP